VRLIIASPKISFKGDVSFGIGNSLQGGVTYNVDLANSGDDIEADVSLDVQAHSSDSVQLLFNQAATLSSVSFDGTGTVLLNAVIQAK